MLSTTEYFKRWWCRCNVAGGKVNHNAQKACPLRFLCAPTLIYRVPRILCQLAPFLAGGCANSNTLSACRQTPPPDLAHILCFR